MKTFALRSALGALVLSIVALFGVVAPAQAMGTSGTDITVGRYYIQATKGQAYTDAAATFTPTGFVAGSTSIAITPALPAGLTLTPGTGLWTVTGTPTVTHPSTSHTVTITGTATSGGSATATATVTVYSAQTITLTTNLTTQAPSTINTSAITVAFASDSLMTGTSGQIKLGVQGLTPADPTSCADVSINVTGLTCTVQSNQWSTYYSWVGVNFTTTSSFTATLASGHFTSKANGPGSFYVTLNNVADSATGLNAGNVSFTIPSAQQQGGGGSGSGQNISGASGSTPVAAATAPVAFTIPTAVGQSMIGSTVDIAITDVAISTDYSVVLRSTPQILASGRTVSSSFNTSVTIPAGLEAGWHSITFNATRTDGTAISEVVYFKINADGTLMATATETPTELAFTGAPAPWGWWVSALILLMGMLSVLIAREINPDFMRVFSMVRNADGDYDMVKRRIRAEDF